MIHLFSGFRGSQEALGTWESMDRLRARLSLCVDTNASSGLRKGQHCGGLGLHVPSVVSPGAGASVQEEEEEELGVGRLLEGPLVTQKPQRQAETSHWRNPHICIHPSFLGL